MSIQAIVQYEVYVLDHGRWALHARYPSAERDDDRDSPLVFISPDIPHRRACAHLKKGRRLTARHARRHFPRQTNTQVFRYSHDAPAKAAIESVRQDHDNKILIHSTSETL